MNLQPQQNPEEHPVTWMETFDDNITAGSNQLMTPDERYQLVKGRTYRADSLNQRQALDDEKLSANLNTLNESREVWIRE